MAWVGAVVQAGMGIYQSIAASKAANNLPEARSYGVSSSLMEAQKDAERRKKEGISAAERAAFEQGMARRTGAAEQAMRRSGLTGVAQGVSNIFNIDAQTQFAVQNEAERRKGEAMYAGIASQIQGIQDQETTSFNQMLQQQRAALGGAAASGMKNITGAFGMAAQAANTNKLAEAYGNSGDTYNYNLGGGTDATTAQVGVSNVPDPDAVSYIPQQVPANVINPVQTTPMLPYVPIFSPTVNPFGTDAETRSFQDYANAQAGYDITKGYGWGPASSAAYGIYGQEFMNQ
jgi:hypothetical protein